MASGSKFVSRLHIAGTLFASPRLPQWQALREFVLMRMQLSMQQTQQLPREQLFRSETPMPAAEVLAVVDEYIAWLSADNATRLGQQVPIYRLKFSHIVF